MSSNTILIRRDTRSNLKDTCNLMHNNTRSTERANRNGVSKQIRRDSYQTQAIFWLPKLHHPRECLIIQDGDGWLIYLSLSLVRIVDEVQKQMKYFFCLINNYSTKEIKCLFGLETSIMWHDSCFIGGNRRLKCIFLVN